MWRKAGNPANSRIEALGRTDFWVWALNKLSDTAGNYETFTYTEDATNGAFRIDCTGNAAQGLSPLPCFNSDVYRMSAIINPVECILLALNTHLTCRNKLMVWDQLLNDLNNTVGLTVLKKALTSLDDLAVSEVLDTLKMESAASSRTRLLLAGAYLEDHVTVCALLALAEGLDVYLLSDLCVARDRRYARILELRLYQAGVVPATLSQFLYIWLGCELIGEHKAKIQTMIRLSDKL